MCDPCARATTTRLTLYRNAKERAYSTFRGNDLFHSTFPCVSTAERNKGDNSNQISHSLRTAQMVFQRERERGKRGRGIGTLSNNENFGRYCFEYTKFVHSLLFEIKYESISRFRQIELFGRKARPTGTINKNEPGKNAVAGSRSLTDEWHP